MHLLEEVLVMSLTRTENYYLHISCDDVIEYCLYKVKALVIGKSGYHYKQGDIVLGHAEFLKDSALAGSLTL